MNPWPYPLWIAHRGAGTLAPENTLAAFRLGAQHGFRCFECDVKISADGVPFLLHDATLERTSNGNGSAGLLPWAALSQLDAGSWHSRSYAGESIPTLQALARWLQASGHTLDLEIKPTPGEEQATGRAIATTVRALWAGAPVPPLLSSFSAEALRAAQAVAPELPRALLIDEEWPDWQLVARELACVAIITNHKIMDEALIAQVRSEGWRAMCYTVNQLGDVQRLLALGIDGLVTDAVDRWAPALVATQATT